MGLMDKFKNLFTDEEVIEEDDDDTIEIKEIKKEEEINKLPTFMREKIEKEEKKTVLKFDKENMDDENVSSSDTDDEDGGFIKLEEKKGFKFPMDLSDNDFVETRSRQTVHKNLQSVDVERSNESIKKEKKVHSEPKVADLYKDKRSSYMDEKPKFRATPIISPIYGILDKNYTTGDIENSSVNNLEERRHSKSVDFDSVRKKAYGSLSQEIKENLMCENCEYLKEAKECRREKKYINESKYSYEILDDEEAICKDVTLDEATENYYDYGVEYEKQPEVSYEKEEVKISNFESEKPQREIPPVKSSINLLSTLKKSMGDDEIQEKKPEDNLELTDDLFNLIDSMYDERNENKW